MTDAEIRSVLDAKAGGPPAHRVPVAELRAGHERETVELSGPGPEVAEVRELEVSGPGGPVPVRLYRPVDGSLHPPALVVYAHGGGWVVGSLDSIDPVCRALAVASGALVASVGYRLAPEHPFPAGLEDVVAVIRGLTERAGELGADPTRVAVAGDSAGANLVTVAARRLRDAGDPPPRFQALVYPVCDRDLTTVSYTEKAEGFGLTADAMRRYWDLYLAGGDGRRPDASPLLAPDLSGLPPAFVLTVDDDVLRDEGEAYARALEAAGVPVTLRRYDGAAHGFLRWMARSELSRRAVAEVGAALRAGLA